MTDLETHAEVFGAVVDEEDGEDLVVDDGADEVGDAVHESVEIEGGVEGVGELVEEVDLEGLDANFWVGGVRVEEDRRGGAIVAFEGMGGRGCFGSGGFRAWRFGGRRHSAFRRSYRVGWGLGSVWLGRHAICEGCSEYVRAWQEIT